MPGERTVLSTLGTLGADLEAEQVKAAGDHRGRRRGRGGASATLLPDGRPLLEIADPADPRLADYRDLRDVQLRKHLEAEHGLFLAEGEKVVRRAVEAGFAPALVPDGAALARRPGRRARHAPTRPATCVSEALAEEVTGFHVHRGALASLERRPLPSVDAVLERRPVGARARGHRRPHQRRRDLPVRRRARLRRRAAGAALRRPALPPLDQGRRWARSSRCRGPGCPTGTTRCRRCRRAGFTTVALTLADDADADRGRVAGLDKVALVLGSEGHGLSPRWEQSADRRAIIPMREGIDSLNVAAATAVACYVTARR